MDKFYNMCEKLRYPLEEIFKDVKGFQQKIRGLQGAYKDLGEEEIKEEIEEEVVKEIEADENLKWEENSAADVATEISDIGEVIEVESDPYELRGIKNWL